MTRLQFALRGISCTNNGKRNKSDFLSCKNPAGSDRCFSRIRSLRTSLAVFRILLSLSYGLSFDNKTILTKGLGKDVLHRMLTVGQLAFRSLAKSASFKKLWGITKDMIMICSDCEFRYMCVDCRILRSDQSNTYSKPLKCKYDPYTANWSK